MSLKVECQLKWNVNQKGILLQKECHSKQNVTKNRMSLKIEFYLILNVTQKGTLLEMDFYLKWNIIKNAILP